KQEGGARPKKRLPLGAVSASMGARLPSSSSATTIHNPIRRAEVEPGVPEVVRRAPSEVKPKTPAEARARAAQAQLAAAREIYQGADSKARQARQQAAETARAASQKEERANSLLRQAERAEQAAIDAQAEFDRQKWLAAEAHAHQAEALA